jgi:hypothetical protein
MEPVNPKIKIVRINVAKLELMLETPNFPKRAVSAAKIAEPTAHACQLSHIFIIGPHDS